MIRRVRYCLHVITYNGVKTLNVEDQYGIKDGQTANFLGLAAHTPFEPVRQRASIRNGEYRFKRPDPNYEIELDLFRNTTNGSDP
jgi:cytosine deaminase